MKKLLSPNFIIISTAFFFFALGNTLFDLIPVHLETLEISKSHTGFIMSFNGLGGFLILPLIAVFIDKIALRKMICAGLVLMALSQALYIMPLSPYPFFAIPMVLRGALFSLMQISFMTLISHIIPGNSRSMGLALFGIMGQLPFPLSIGLGESLYYNYGLNIIILVSFMCFAASFIFLRSSQEDSRNIEPGPEKRSLKDFIPVFRNSGIYPFLIAFFCLGYVFGTFLVYLPGFLFSRSINRIGLFWIIFPAVIIIIRLFFSRFFDRQSRGRTLLLPLLSLPLSMLSLLFVRSYPMLIIPGILYGISHGISFPVLTAALIDHAPPGFRGRMVVIAQLMFTLGIFLSSYIGGTIAEAVSIDAVVLFTSAFSGTAAFLFIYLTIKRRPCCD